MHIMSTIINFIFLIIFIYLLVYGVYLLNINIKAFGSGKFLALNAPEKYTTEEFKNNKICVIIFANSKTKRLEPLLKALNEQTYSKENYSVHVVFAKDSNVILYTPDCMAGAQIHSIENKEYFKKDKAINLFIDKLIQTSKFDSYVFLGADRFVPSDYMETVNIALNKFKNCVITGKTTVLSNGRANKLKAKAIATRQEYKNNTINLVRRMFDLATCIDSENCVIPSEILERTGKVSFETKEAELKYSLSLASCGLKPIYSPYMETYVEASDYNPATAGPGSRISLFKYYAALLVNKPLYFIEFVISLIMPNIVCVILLYLTLLYASFKFISTISMKYVLHLGVFYLLVWIIGIISSKINPAKVIYFFLYPFYSFAFNMKKISMDFSKRAMQRAIIEEKDVKSATMDAVVTDGKRNVCCKMDIMTEDGMRSVILRFRKKRVISNESIRMYDAVENISKRIKTHGYTLKICQNCKYFNITQDGTLDLLKGTCSINGESKEDLLDTLIWNRCECFCSKEETNSINELNNGKE